MKKKKMKKKVNGGENGIETHFWSLFLVEMRSV